MVKQNNKLKISIVLNLFAILFLVIEKIMDDTILANVLFFTMALIGSTVAVLVLTFEKSNQYIRTKIYSFIAGILLICYCVFMFLSDNIPVGYTP